jgi:AraC-like DNA-binding protein
MSAYRNRFRVRQVLADLQDGERRLRDLAARYGFADQAHMIRVVRRHAGDSPSVLRELLRA